MYSYSIPHLSPAFVPLSNSPSPRNPMPFLLRVLCTSSPIPQSKPIILNPPIHSPICKLKLPPLPPEPEPDADLKEKILSLETMGFNTGRILRNNPGLHEASLQSIHHIIYYLECKGIRQKDLIKTIDMCPNIITASIKDDLQPTFDFLSKDLEVPKKNFYMVIKKCPRLLDCSARDQLKPALNYFQRLGIKDKFGFAYRYPVLLVLNVEKTIMPKVDFLMSLGLSQQEAEFFIYRKPGLLTFSIENNFKPKAEYFFSEMKGSLEELKDFPQYFACSLEGRIKPRHRELVEKGIEMPLAVMLKSMDIEFRKLVEHLVEDRQTTLCFE
ncbi:mTERF [Carex littledalei]|uniref:mTERF n=1 Tax=Carex littledalei TaxID=544730 RepID=A0A833QX92_9POAL|nr:mTERF [Carex littledalei]